jgi:DNA-binding NtrC family response regulator
MDMPIPVSQQHIEPGRRVLVVDLDAGVRWSLERGLAHSGYMVFTADAPETAIRIALEQKIDAVILEIFPENGLTLDLLGSIVGIENAPTVVCTSISSSPNLVINCMRRGAVGFIGKPFSLAAIRTELANSIRSKEGTRPSAAAATSTGAEEGSLLVGVSKTVQELRSIIKQVAQTDLNCLIRGESGVGKDLVAREIHRMSQRHEHPFIKVNCSALPEQLLESELFGFEKGAFTGALASKPGRFSLANKGIIFLDEIGDMHLSVQAKLLQVIEHKEFTKLGGRRPCKVDVQIVAATNVDIEQQAKKGIFRHDLFFRLNEVCIWVPSLSERKEDIPFLVRHFMEKHNRFLNGESIELTGQDMAELCERPWPGNVRELESTIKRWLALKRRDFPSATFMAPAPMQAPEPDPEMTPALSNGDASPETILRVLEDCQWNRRKATEILGISYQALRRRIIKYKLDQR